jgi:hypothetical protein
MLYCVICMINNVKNKPDDYVQDAMM